MGRLVFASIKGSLNKHTETGHRRFTLLSFSLAKHGCHGKIKMTLSFVCSTQVTIKHMDSSHTISTKERSMKGKYLIYLFIVI